MQNMDEGYLRKKLLFLVRALILSENLLNIEIRTKSLSWIKDSKSIRTARNTILIIRLVPYPSLSLKKYSVALYRQYRNTLFRPFTIIFISVIPHCTLSDTLENMNKS